jgi:hypothetical protein
VWPGRRVAVPFQPIKLELARFARRRFGSAGQMRITEKIDHYEIDVRIEGKPAHDPDFVRHERMAWHAYLMEMFGMRTRVELRGPKVEAGDVQNGKPRDQLVIIPQEVLESTRLAPSER